MAKGGIAPAFERFRQASDFTLKSKETQVNTLKWEKGPTALFVWIERQQKQARKQVQRSIKQVRGSLC